MIFSGNKYKQWFVAEYFGYILDLNVSEEPMTGRSPKKNKITLQSRKIFSFDSRLRLFLVHIN